MVSRGSFSSEIYPEYSSAMAGSKLSPQVRGTSSPTTAVSTTMPVVPQTYTGSVVAPGPGANWVTTSSSSERVRASSAPPATPGAIYGRVTWQNAFQRLA